MNFIGERLNTSVFGCGYNGFSQLSYAQCESANEGLDHSTSKQDFLHPEFLHSVSGNDAVVQIQACWTTILVLFGNTVHFMENYPQICTYFPGLLNEG